MKKLTTTLCLTVALLFGCAGVVTGKGLQDSKELLSTYCSKKRCTDPVSKLEINKFILEAKNCVYTSHGFVDGCILKFGIIGNEIEESLEYNNSYRIINGPVPFMLHCSDGRGIGFADLILDHLRDHYGIETYTDRHSQNGERIYYHNPPDKLFSFFQRYKTTIGVLINQWGGSGNGDTSLYLFDTETGESSKRYGDCGGWPKSFTE